MWLGVEYANHLTGTQAVRIVEIRHRSTIEPDRAADDLTGKTRGRQPGEIAKIMDEMSLIVVTRAVSQRRQVGVGLDRQAVAHGIESINPGELLR